MSSSCECSDRVVDEVSVEFYSRYILYLFVKLTKQCKIELQRVLWCFYETCERERFAPSVKVCNLFREVSQRN